MWQIHAQQNYLPTPLPRAKGLRHRNFTSRIKKRKKLCDSRTELRNNSTGLKLCKTCVQGHIILHSASHQGCKARKKSEIRFRKNTGAVKRFSTYRTWRRKCFNSSERCSFWQILKKSFLQQLKAKSHSPIRHAWKSPVTQFAFNTFQQYVAAILAPHREPSMPQFKNPGS